MTTFSIESDALRAAVRALTPFVPKPENKHDDTTPETRALLQGHVLDGKRLWLTAVGDPGYAIAWLDMLDFDGELTDFAIHRDDLAMLQATFRRKERSVEFRVTHKTWTEPPATDNDRPKHMRNTSLDVEETGQLFGAARVTFAGADGREVRTRSTWANIALAAKHAQKVEAEWTKMPGKVMALTSAAETAYGDLTTYRLTSSGQVLATVGRHFAALLWTESTADTAAAAQTEEGLHRAWATTLNDHLTDLPNHLIYD